MGVLTLGTVSATRFLDLRISWSPNEADKYGLFAYISVLDKLALLLNYGLTFNLLAICFAARMPDWYAP
jgi:hypothetical protein